MKTLLQLLHQYKGDVEQRIKCAEYERDNSNEKIYIVHPLDSYETQIAYWEAALKQIDKALVKYDEAIQIKIISILYEWVCPDCNRRNEGSGIDEKVVCTGCNKSFKINFVQNPQDTP